MSVGSWALSPLLVFVLVSGRASRYDNVLRRILFYGHIHEKNIYINILKKFHEMRIFIRNTKNVIDIMLKNVPILN